jgi:hypothetical protein
MRVPKLIPFERSGVSFEKFFSKLKDGEIFTYSDAFLFHDVKEFGLRYGWNVIYCEPTTPEYKEHGCFTCRAYRKYAKMRATVTIDYTVDCTTHLRASIAEIVSRENKMCLSDLLNKQHFEVKRISVESVD